MERKDRFVDELLESALHHRPEAEPRSGLESRILERVHASASERRSRRGLWFAATAAAAAAAICIAVLVMNRPRTPALQTPQAHKAAPAPPQKTTLSASTGETPAAGAIAITTPARKESRVRKPHRRAAAPHWPAQFPTPAPLTKEEKALIRYVQETPPKVLAEPIFKGKLTIQHVEIKPVEIPPVVIKPVEFGNANMEIQ